MKEKDLEQEKDIHHKVLIVDDLEFNRDLLSEMLEAEYEVVQASSGEEAISILNKEKKDFACVLLDLNMDGVNGFDVLSYMGEKNWLITLPVIIISAEEKPDLIKRAYNLGAIDFINRPFDTEIVKRRVQNIIAMYAKQKKLAKLFINQVMENERISNMLLSVLGHIVEFRNRESGEHIENVGEITEFFLNKLVSKTDKYNLSKKDIKTITRASSLHDAGKISVPENILNKPGKLTSEEFEIMKLHTVNGAEMLNTCIQFRDEPIVKTAYNICRWHHERYDGKGYPDGLVGDKIPIEAQVVALADVYDALTSVRCYKKAFTHEKAIEMILNGECGAFNPLLLDILRESEPKLKKMVSAKKSKVSKAS